MKNEEPEAENNIKSGNSNFIRLIIFFIIFAIIAFIFMKNYYNPKDNKRIVSSQVSQSQSQSVSAQ